MAHQWRTRWRTQHGRFRALLVRSDDLCRQEPGADGDAHGPLLVVGALPLLQGPRSRLRGMGEGGSGLVCGAPGASYDQHFAERMKAKLVKESRPRTHATW